jgi:ribonuclease P protein component
MQEYPKSARLLKAREFRRTYDEGTRQGFGGLFVAFWRWRGDEGEARFGFTCPRALGKAVVRNRIRRRLRECVRLGRDRFPRGVDIVFNPRKSLLDAPWGEIERQTGKLVERLKAETESTPCVPS